MVELHTGLLPQATDEQEGGDAPGFWEHRERS